ncbi:MAG: DUF3047 domain-containing protein [Gemmatimonadota bacterium]|nr:DUF3047 domain-containing protein [Gemmatimonadota bacterium]
MRRHILAGLAGCCVLSLYTASAQDTPPAGGEHEAPPYIVIEDFASTPLDSLPRGWRWRGKDDDKPKLYSVREVNGRRYLAAQDTGHSVVLMKIFRWDPRQYPIMTWCWRADALPLGGDERYTKTNDSAAGVSVVFSRFLSIPRQIKYVWSTTLAPGTVSRRKGIGRPWFVVLQSGPEKLGQWLQEWVDLEKDHERILSSDLPKKTLGITLLTDADATRGYAAAAYADFRVWPRAALAHIPNYCAGLPP